MAFLSVPIATLLSATAVFGGELIDVLAGRWTQLFTNVLPQLVVLIVFAIVAEEIGFMGFLQARWQDRFGPLKASVMVTVPFALSHVPNLMVESHLGLSKIFLLLAYLSILAVLQMFGRIVMMWLYNVTGSSVCWSACGTQASMRQPPRSAAPSRSPGRCGRPRWPAFGSRALS